ncbi:MAG: hypothetical protein HeimC2_15580 [Candidatus Heimdallarchaeota archaeon LC_2]|nr:MAG: hypothetical protein HeimC2_15580 [Candidatus Heimdallarchaeota archaeon LC_2]
MLAILIVQPVNPNSITADRDASGMGIENGDQFLFIMESLIVTAGYGFNPPFLESDFFAGDNITIGTGDEFTMTIVNATPQVIDEGYSILITLSNNSYGVTTDLIIGNTGLITFPGWGFWEKEMDEFLASFDNVGEVRRSSGTIQVSFRMINTKEIELNKVIAIERILVEIHYDAITGVLLYLAVIVDTHLKSGARLVDYEIILRQIGYTFYDPPFVPHFQTDIRRISSSSFNIIQITLVSIVLLRIIFSKKGRI